MKRPMHIHIEKLIDNLSITSNRNDLKELECNVTDALIRAVESVKSISEDVHNGSKAKLELNYNGHTLITADSIKELQAKVNYEKALLNENEKSAVVYSAVVSSFSIT